MKVLRHSFRNDPERDMNLTAELLRSVADRLSPPTVRIFRPGPTLAFGKQDSFRRGFEQASALARRHGFEPVIRLAGGHAVAYDEKSVVVEFVRPESQLLGPVEPRYAQLSALIQASVAQFGVNLELGELPGEYCPGRFSLHLPGGPKVAGIAQRVIKAASLTSAVVAVGASQRVEAVTAAVYASLGLDLDVSTVGAIADRFPGVVPSEVADKLAQLASGHLEESGQPVRMSAWPSSDTR